MTTLCIDSDLDLGTTRRPEHRLGAGWGLEQRRCLEILGDEFSGVAQRLADKPYEPMFDDVSALRFGS
jgi:hypothetical protein